MHCLFVIHSQQKGFLVALAKLIAAEHKVSFLAGDSRVAELIRNQIPNADIVVEGEFSENIDVSVIERSRQLEDAYSVRFSLLLSHDRALGRGYIFNADKYPSIGRAWWPHERKLLTLLSRFDQTEALLARYTLDCIVSLQKDPVRFLVASKHGIHSFSLAPVKLGRRFLWSDDPYLTSSSFLGSIRRNLNRELCELYEIKEYVQEAGSKLNHSLIQYTWIRAVKDSARQILMEHYKVLRGTRKKDSYPFLGWVPVILRRPSMYKYFLRNGKKPEELKGKRICYVPLHLEPEIALLSLSPEFNNSMEMISWLSKVAPADVIIVVKEQPFSFGIRSKRYYDQLRQISNVELAHPETTSWEWIKASAVTATITGTAGTEAVMFKKPVLSFGRHQAINHLPTVRFASNYETTLSGMDDLLSIQPDDPEFERARRAFYTAQLETSFELPGFERTYKSSELQPENARIAAEHLAAVFRDEFAHRYVRDNSDR